MASEIELHIEELVLHGFPAGDRYRIAEALEQELARVLGERDVPSFLVREGDTGCLDGGSFKLTHGARAEVVGREAAQAIYKGMAVNDSHRG